MNQNATHREIFIHIDFNHGGMRNTRVIEQQRVLLDYYSPEFPGAEAAHWRAALERLSLLMAEDAAGEAADAAAFEECGRVIGDLERNLAETSEQLQLQQKQSAAWAEAYALLASEYQKGKLGAAKTAPAKKKPAKKVARKRARK